MNKSPRSRQHAASVHSVRPHHAQADAQDPSPALPRTSRFRAHDHEAESVRGCLGAPARYEQPSSDAADDRG
jgi:hypothetical protein